MNFFTVRFCIFVSGAHEIALTPISWAGNLSTGSHESSWFLTNKEMHPSELQARRIRPHSQGPHETALTNFKTFKNYRKKDNKNMFIILIDSNILYLYGNN